MNTTVLYLTVRPQGFPGSSDVVGVYSDRARALFYATNSGWRGVQVFEVDLVGMVVRGLAFDGTTRAPLPHS
jgi:hypothetical protein